VDILCWIIYSIINVKLSLQRSLKKIKKTLILEKIEILRVFGIII
jgi:hypothetical protein